MVRGAALRKALPRGRMLPRAAWRKRHRAIMVLLWAHAIMIPIYAGVMGFSTWHAILDSIMIPAAAGIASIRSLAPRARAIVASIGLLSASAVLVHASGGLIEMHFHFFVMLAVVALYQDWPPFLMAIGYVFIHHGALGALDAASVYNHPAALANPWKWAGVHALFVTGSSVASLVTWRLNEVALAQRRRAERRLRRHGRMLQRINDVGRVLAAELDLNGVMQRVTELGTDITGAAFGAFFYNLDDGLGERYALYTSAGIPRERFERFPMPRNTPLFAPTFAGERIIRLDDVTADPRYGQMSPHHGMPQGHMPVRSYLAVPVRSRGEVLGGLFFGHPEVGRFTAQHEHLAAGIAAHAAVAIDNARLYDSERRARQLAERSRARVGVLAEASRILSASLELDDILKDLCGVVVPDIADTCVVYLRDDAGALRMVAARASDEVMDRVKVWMTVPDAPPGDRGPIHTAVTTGQTLVFDSVDDALLVDTIPDVAHRELVQRLAPTSAIVVPLLRRGVAIGALAIGTVASTGNHLGADDKEFAEELGRRAAVAVENANLFSAQRTVAEALQRSLLLERLPQIPGVETAVRYAPGGPDIEVGGDWYDVLELPDGSIALVMGDVVGRGIAAAALMGQLRTSLRAFALEGHPPAEILQRLNRMLHELGPDGAMATLVYAAYEPESGTLRVANAGHLPPLVVGIDSEGTFLEAGNGLPIGVRAWATYTETITTLAPGATLVLYTDGLVEDRDTPLEAGLENLRRSIDARTDLDATCERILTARTAASEVKDDIAVLAMRPAQLGDRLKLRLPAKPTVLKPLRSTLRRWLTNAGASEAQIFDILVAAGEACTNAVRHAGRATVAFTLEAHAGDEVTIVVRSEGPWRVPRDGEGGRGLDIIEHLMDAVELHTSPTGVEVTMKRALRSTVSG